MNRPIRVLFLIGELTPGGGSESHLEKLITNLDKEQFSLGVTVFSGRGARAKRIRASGVPVYDLGIEEDGQGVLSYEGIRRIHSLIGRIHSLISFIKPDIVHSYGFTFNFLSAVLTFYRKGIRTITTRRGKQPAPHRHLLYRMTNPLVDKVVCVSQATEKFTMTTEGLPKRKSVVIPNGINVNSFSKKSQFSRDIKTIGTLGRIREVKGTDLLLEAFTHLKHRLICLKIAGPADRAWGLSLQYQHQYLNKVTFLGEIEDVAGFLQSLDLFVLPSRSEGMSNALLEAMSVGLPIVATDVGSNAEVLAGGKAGILVQPNAQSIAAGVTLLLEDPISAKELGVAARQRVEAEYGLSTMVKCYERLYLELANTNRKGAFN